MNIQGSIDWSTVIGACVTVSATLLSLMSGPISEYINDRRKRNSWENILKEIDVFNRWVDEGRIETIQKLYSHIEESINERFVKGPNLAYWLPTVAVGLLDFWYCVTAFLNRQWPVCAISALSLLCICASAMFYARGNVRRAADRKRVLQAFMDASANEMASHIQDTQTEEEKLVRLERNDDIDARWVAHLSRGSIYNRRLYSECWHDAREKAEDRELKRLVDQVMQLPTEPPTDEG